MLGANAVTTAQPDGYTLLFATNGKFYSLDVAKLPGGRGHGEPIRMFIDMEQDAAIVSLFVNKGERKFLIASSEGQGFVVKEEDCVGNTRKGKQVLNVTMPNEACAITTVAGDTVAVIGTNHKMVLFPLDQVPEMARSRGVRLQIDYLKAEFSLQQHGVKDTIVVFGSTRICEPAAARRKVEALSFENGVGQLELNIHYDDALHAAHLDQGVDQVDDPVGGNPAAAGQVGIGDQRLHLPQRS